MKYFVYSVILIVAASIVAGFFIVGSPTQGRLVKLDERRVSDLQSIQWNIVNFWQRKERLPEVLDELRDDIAGTVIPGDPETGRPYEYRALDKLGFELCAEFTLSSDESFVIRPAEPLPVKGLPENWEHDTGRFCFKRTIDPELYPSLKEPKR